MLPSQWVRHCSTSSRNPNGNLESGMNTSMNSNGFSLISSGTIMWNMYDGLPSAWLKFIKLHKKSRQSLRRQVQLPDSKKGKTNITCCAPVGVEYKSIWHVLIFHPIGFELATMLVSVNMFSKLDLRPLTIRDVSAHGSPFRILDWTCCYRLSDLCSHTGYFTEEFQASRLTVFAVIGALD